MEGNFILAGVRRRRYPVESKFEIYGEEEVEFGDGVQIDDKPWFQQFLEDQNQFHFGFNDLNDPKVIAEFKKIEKRFKKPAKDVTKSRKLNTTKPRALPAKKAAKKPTKRGRGDSIA